MGLATITNRLGEGRYRIKIDSGESRRTALLSAANQALAAVGAKINASQELVTQADTIEAQSRANITALIDMLVAESDPTAAGLAQKVLAIEQKKYAQLVASNQPLRQQHATLKNAQADLVRQRSAWDALQTITYKEAWCTDYTVNASGSSRATIDIPGDPSLTLLAPGCRSARSGDRTISSASKAAALSQRANELIKANENLAAVNTSLTTAGAAETTLKAEVAAAQATYIAAPTEANYAAFEAKTLELAAKRHEIANLTVSKQVVDVTIARLNQEIAYWFGRPSSETPDPGDGALLERDLVSPAQAYFNAAIFPAWQKWMPTYRWGVASSVNEATNTMTVTLASATSLAQRLNVNKESTLNNVPVVYMTCHAAAFEDGDNVVVGFTGQSFESPTVIGFLDNPRECRAWPETVVMDLLFETLPGASPGTRKWANVVAWWEEGEAAGCSGANYRYSIVAYDAGICPSAMHSFRLERPEFSDSNDDTYFDLNVVDGEFSTLWTGESSAWLFDTAHNSNRVPGGVGLANSFACIDINVVRLRELTTSSFTQGTVHSHVFSSGPGACLYVTQETSGAWLHPGTNIDSMQPEVTETMHFDAAPEEFLNSLGALPTAITVTRKRGGKTPSPYVLIGVSDTETGLTRRWRFTYERQV